jgi:8-oxo-dGTP pyrophosphatase MutT (NUDIX family)
MARLITFDHVQQAVDLANFDPDAMQHHMSPIPRGWQKRDFPPKQAAVLILLYPEDDDRLNVVLTLRNERLRGHSGQVSFPGGKQDPTDVSFTVTALRETCEEIGICDDNITVIGEISKFYIPPTHYDVYPTVAKYSTIPNFNPNPDEVAAVFSFALEDVLNPKFKQVEYRTIQGYNVKIPYYNVKGHKVWGATAIMLGEFEARLRTILPDNVIDTIEHRS